MQKVFKTESTKVNRDTGEIISDETITRKRVSSEPAYVKWYVDDISRLMQLNSTASKVLAAIVKYIDYESVIILSSSRRKAICEETGYSAQTVKNSLTVLKGLKIINSIGMSEYFADPNLFAKGKWTDVLAHREKMKIIISYSDEGRKIETKVDTGVISEDGESYFVDYDGANVELM